MTFDIITIFPHIFESYFSASIINRAIKKGLIKVNIHNLRDYTHDKRKTVDDTPYGGGAGMILKIAPIDEAIRAIKKRKKCRIIIFSAKGKMFTQKDAHRLAKYENLILICGRYEGVDERVARYIADEEISVGSYILTGGEIPAMIFVDSISRLLPGALGNAMSLEEESFNSSGFVGQRRYLEYPQYTKPEKYRKWNVPRVILSGNHSAIKEWRHKKTKNRDLIPGI